MNQYNGAVYPCKICKQSHRNTVHTNPQQFGYHTHVGEQEEALPKEADRKSLVHELIEECLDAWYGEAPRGTRTELVDDIVRVVTATQENEQAATIERAKLETHNLLLAIVNWTNSCPCTCSDCYALRDRCEAELTKRDAPHEVK